MDSNAPAVTFRPALFAYFICQCLTVFHVNGALAKTPSGKEPPCPTYLTTDASNETDSADASFRILTIPGDENHRRLVLNQGAKDWFELGARKWDGVRSDPRWVIDFMGVEVAAFLGYSRLPDGTYQVPTSDYLIKQIDAYNKAFPLDDDRIWTGFYVASGKFSDLEYVKVYVEEGGKIPASFEGTFYIHDIIQHLLWIGAPKDILDLSRMQAKWISKFRQFVELHEPTSPWIQDAANRDIAMATQRILDSRYVGKNIDNLTGFMNLMHLPAAKAYRIAASRSRQDLDQLMEEKFRARLYDGRSPFEILDQYVTRTQDEKLIQLFDLFQRTDLANDAHFKIQFPAEGVGIAFRHRLERIKSNISRLTKITITP